MKKFFKIPVIPSHINIFLIGLFMLATGLQAQTLQENDKKLNRETNKILKTAEEELGDNNFPSAEASYRKAVSKNESSTKARYNMANMYYGKEKPAQATAKYREAAKVAETKDEKHDVFHNLGNSYMDQKKYGEAVEAYKNALRNNPADEQTRYNLALAKKKLEKEQQDDKKDDQKDKEQEKEDQNKDKKEDDKGEKDKKDQGDNKENEGGDKDKEKKKEPEKPDDKGEPKNENEQKDEKGDQEKEQPQQPQPGQLSPQQIKNLLEAMNNEEKKVQDKINAEKAKGAKTRTAKDW